MEINYMLTPEGIESGYAQAPLRKHPGDGGADLFASKGVVIPPRSQVKVSTGVCVEIPMGTVGYITPRSGIALRDTVTVLNAPGTIDAGYTGELEVILMNLSDDKEFVVSPGDRIAQFVLHPVYLATFKRVDSLGETDRGENGFGSTGVQG